MKMTNAQYRLMTEGIDAELDTMNLSREAVCTISDCWRLFQRFLRRKDPERPVGFGKSQDWLFPGLNDSHFETAFRKMMREVGKTI